MKIPAMEDGIMLPYSISQDTSCATVLLSVTLQPCKLLILLFFLLCFLLAILPSLTIFLCLGCFEI